MRTSSGMSLRGVLRTSLEHAPWSERLDEWGRSRNVPRRPPQENGRGSLLAFRIGPCGDILRALHWDVLRSSYFNIQRMLVEDVLRTSAGDFPLRYIEDHMEMSIGDASGRLTEAILTSRLGF